MTFEATKTMDMNNNESLVCGISHEHNGTYTAVTFTKSKNFKTLKGAENWLARNGGYDDE